MNNNIEEYFRESEGEGIDDDNFNNLGSGTGFHQGDDFAASIPEFELPEYEAPYEYEPIEYEEPEFDISELDIPELDLTSPENFGVGLTGAREQALQTAEFDATLLDQSDLTFDSEYYLEQNSDVVTAKIDPNLHFDLYGKSEDREYRFLLNDDYTPEGNRFAAVDITKDTFLDLEDSSILEKYIYFDHFYYLKENPDIAAAEIDPITHFSTYGESEGREYRYVYLFDLLTQDEYHNEIDSEDSLLSASGSLTGGEQDFGSITVAESEFDRNYYLAQNSDVVAAGVDPYEHYVSLGQAEGRIPYADFEPLSNQTYLTETVFPESL